ncbi:MAG TPA: hypothetical protein VI790_06210 [Candidatus Nanoarchaeia archaeon]|nr:hypothetical protein [Candidatus Nanoarchaeia archaeon]
MRRAQIALIILLTIGCASAEDVCRYIPGQTIFKCNDVLPNIVVMPGTSANLTIYCCLTGDTLNNTETNYNTQITIIHNETFRKQISTNGTLSIQENLKIYKASDWITSIDAPESLLGFEEFPIKVELSIPYDNSLYPAEIIKARFDVLVDLPGGMAPNIAVLPNIIISQGWAPINYNLIYTVIIVSIIIIAGLFIFKRLKRNKMMKEAMTKELSSKTKKRSNAKKKSKRKKSSKK